MNNLKIEYSRKSVKYINSVDKPTKKRLREAYIDLKNIATEELKNVDPDMVNVNCSLHDFEPQLQY